MVEISDDGMEPHQEKSEERELDNLILFYRKKKIDEEKVAQRRQAERDRLKKLKRGGYGNNNAMNNLMGQSSDPESFRRMQEMKAVPVNKFPEIYK